jgi:hypothetical protein
VQRRCCLSRRLRTAHEGEWPKSVLLRSPEVLNSNVPLAPFIIIRWCFTVFNRNDSYLFLSCVKCEAAHVACAAELPVQQAPAFSNPRVSNHISHRNVMRSALQFPASCKQ